MSPQEKELLNRYLNGDLEGAELEAFYRRLDSSTELKQALARASLDEVLLSEIVLENREPAAAFEKRSRRWKVFIPSAAAALLLLGFLSFALWFRPGFATVTSVRGEGVLVREGRTTPLTEKTSIRDGDELRTRQGSMILTYDDQTAILTVGRDSRVVFKNQGRRVELRNGSLGIDGGPLDLSTRHGDVTAGGRWIFVAAGQERLQVRVPMGTAQVKPSRGSPLQLSEGQYASVSANLVETGRYPSEERIRVAVDRAATWLAQRPQDILRPLREGKRHRAVPQRTYGELALLALPSESPAVEDILRTTLDQPLECTYAAALRAVLLSHLDAKKYRTQIAECAQFLADNQCESGQWDYGEPVAPFEGGSVVRQRKPGPPTGDNSVSSFAVLGLRACQEAGVSIDTEIVLKARRWWLEKQNPDGGWGSNDAKQPQALPVSKYTSDTSYGSMTASGIASVALLSEMLGERGRNTPAVSRGLQWLARNYAVDHNPLKDAGFAHMHFLLALQRAGQGLGIEQIGGHDWYADGVDFLLPAQRPDGFWRFEQGTFMAGENNDVLDTCLAVIFLRRIPFSVREGDR